MRLIEELERMLGDEQSLFRAQVLREDIARLNRLQELARTAADLSACKTASLRMGWTPGDLRTHELLAPLEALVEAVYAGEKAAGGGEHEARILKLWAELYRVRMERLAGCLATRAPRPD